MGNKKVPPQVVAQHSFCGTIDHKVCKQSGSRENNLYGSTINKTCINRKCLKSALPIAHLCHMSHTLGIGWSNHLFMKHSYVIFFLMNSSRFTIANKNK